MNEQEREEFKTKLLQLRDKWLYEKETMTTMERDTLISEYVRAEILLTIKAERKRINKMILDMDMLK